MHSNLYKKLSKLEKTARDLGFKWISYGLFTFAYFADMRFSIDRKSLTSIEYQSNQTACNSFVFILNLSFLSWASM